MDTQVSESDAELWKRYITELQKNGLGGKPLNSQTEALFAVPIGLLSIPAGVNVPAPIKNDSLFQVADTLLSPNNPVFTPGTGSYVDRQSRHLRAIELKKNNNTNIGAQLRLQQAKERQAEIQAKFDQVQEKARSAFKADAGKGKRTPFRVWVSRNYPQYDSIQSYLQQATSATESASIEVYGPGVHDINRKVSQLNQATSADEPHPGLNMPVSKQPASLAQPTELDPDITLDYRPLYAVDNNYGDILTGWINSSKSPTQIAKIDTSDPEAVGWEKSGFKDTAARVTGPYSFIFAQTDQEHRLTVEDLGGKIQVSVNASGVQAFNVKPGTWDGDFANSFKNTTLQAGFKVPAACAVSQVIVGFNVSLDVGLDDDAARKVADLYSKTLSAGGSVSIFGIPIGVGATAENPNATKYKVDGADRGFGKFSIRGEDGAYTAVLGVVARKLPAIGQ